MNLPEPQRWDPEHYARHARFVSDLGRAVVELLAPRAGERILDLGCGDGALTEDLQHAGCEVVGVDASPEMVAAARSRGVDARLADARALSFDHEFDAVFSNAVLHWIPDPAAVIDSVARALKPGGRFVGEFGGKGNVAAIVGALESVLASHGIDAPSPWYFPSCQEYQRRLEERGLIVESIELFPRPTPLPGDMRGWLQTFARPFLERVPAEKVDSVVSDVVERLRLQLFDAQSGWTADYIRLRFAARKP